MNLRHGTLAKYMGAFALCCVLPLHAAEWTLTPNSQVTFGIKSVGLSIVEGRFNKVQSNLKFDPEIPHKGSAHLVLDVDSISFSNPSLKGLILGSEYFDAAEFKHVKFVSKQIEPVAYAKYMIRGDLTIRGITKPVIFDTTLAPSPQNPKVLDVQSLATIKRSDFGMRKALGGVGEQVLIQLKGQWRLE